MVKNGCVKWMIPELQEQIEIIITERGYEGRGSESKAQERLVEYIKVGKETERMFEKMTLGLYKDRRNGHGKRT